MPKEIADMSIEELEAGINDYRASLGLPPLPASGSEVSRTADPTPNAPKIVTTSVVNHTGPLPLRLAADVGLGYIPSDKRNRYARQMDGSFALRFIDRSDTESIQAYEKEIAAAKLPVLLAGETPESIEAANREKEARVASVLKMADDADARRRKEAFDAHNKQLAEQHQRDQAELRRRYGIK